MPSPPDIQAQYFTIPLVEAATPVAGHVWVDSWWLTDVDGNPYFFHSGPALYPQCNVKREVVLACVPAHMRRTGFGIYRHQYIFEAPAKLALRHIIEANRQRRLGL